MNLFYWNTSFELGIPQIDQQHRHLVDMLNTLSSAIADGDKLLEVEAIVGQLINYAAAHFADEERWLDSSALPEDEKVAHLKAHRDFAAKAKEILGNADLRQFETAERVLEFLTTWLISHILGSDMKIARPELSDKAKSPLTVSPVERTLINALSESERRFCLISDHAPSLIWVSDPTGSRAYSNQACYDYVGITQKKAKHVDWFHFIHPDDQAAYKALLERISTKPEPAKIEYRLRKFSGEYGWIQETILPRLNAGEGFMGLIASGTDISALKRAEIQAAKRESTRAEPPPAGTVAGLLNPVMIPVFIAMALGLSTIAGWHLHLPALVQIHASLVPMQYNTGLGFVLSCAAFLLNARYPKLARALAFLVLALGGLTLVEHIGDIDLGLDQLFMQHYITTLTSSPGRMSPMSALGFVLVGFALSAQSRQSRHPLLSVALATVVLFISGTAFLGYLLGSEIAYGWGAMTRMALHTTVAFGCLSAALLIGNYQAAAASLERKSFYFRLNIGFLSILSLFVILGLVAVEKINAVSVLTDKFFRHPFTVSVAALGMKNDVAMIHRNMRNVMLNPDKALAAQSFAVVDELDLAFEEKLNIVRQKFLGPKENMDHLQRDFSNWRAWRTESRRLFWEGHHELYAKRTNDVGRSTAADLEMHLDGVVEFARNKAIEFNVSATKARDDAVKLVAIVIIAAVMLAMLFATTLTRGVARQLRSLRGAMIDVTQGSTNEEIPYVDHLNDVGDIARSVEIFRGYAIELSRQEVRFRQMVESAPQGMIMVDERFLIIMVNSKAEQLFGYERAELIGRPPELLMPEALRDSHIHARTDFSTALMARDMGTGGRPLRVRRKGGSEFNAEIGLSPIATAGGIHVLLSIIDVTERERNHRMLEEAKHSAEQALERQHKMQDELVRSEKMAALGGLVAGVAHEINTPVGITLSAATHLEAETRKTDVLYQAGELTEDDLADYFATVRQAVQLMTLNSQRASDLIQSFKQVAVDQTGDQQRKFNLAGYIDEVLLSLRPQLKKTHVAVHVECPPELFIDGFPGALSQVLTNLIVNSLTHAFSAEQAGHISITVRTADTQGEWIELVYKDDGKGIPPELHEKVFEPFYTTRRGSGGSGLGLHIVFNIVHNTLKGTISLESAVGKGASFALRFPRNLTN